MKKKDILFSKKGFWVINSRKCGMEWDGYLVMQDGLTHSTEVAIIGWKGQKGMDKAKAEIERRLKETI